jgi:MFS family permease
MDWRNRIGLYGAYFLGMAGIGFTLPYLPLYLGQQGMSDRAIGQVSTLAALASLAQFPLGIWSDRLGRRKPFLLVALAVLACSTVLLDSAHGTIWLGFLVVLFAENGICRATVESMAGAEAAHLAPPDQVGVALGALRFWKPVSIVIVALAGGIVAEHYGIQSVLLPLAAVQTLAVIATLLIHERKTPLTPWPVEIPVGNGQAAAKPGRGLHDGVLWIFVAAMVLFHVANAPGGVYLGLFMKRDLGAPERELSYAFVVSMIAWMLAVRPVGRWADRLGCRPLLLAGWSVMTLRLALIALAQESWQVLAIQILDGTAQSLFAVAAAVWVTARLADPRRVGEAQTLVGTALVFGSAVGPLLSSLVVADLGYRGMFGLLAGIGAATTAIIAIFVPETVKAGLETSKSSSMATASLSGAPLGEQP